MEWLLISFVGILAVAAVNRFVIGIVLSGQAALREGQSHAGPDRRRPRFGWIMVRLPAVPMLEYRPGRPEPASAPAGVGSKRRRNWWMASFRNRLRL